MEHRESIRSIMKIRLNRGIKTSSSSNDGYKSNEIVYKYGLVILVLIAKIKNSNGTRKLRCSNTISLQLGTEDPLIIRKKLISRRDIPVLESQSVLNLSR